MLSAVGVTLLYALTEFLLVRWTLASVGRRPVVAAAYSGVIRALSSAGMLLVVASPALVMAAILGDALGSLVGVAWSTEDEEEDDGDQGEYSEGAGEEDP